jgi:hypothetical protein
VGIGTTSPVQALHVAVASNDVARFESTTLNGSATIELKPQSSSGKARIDVVDNAADFSISTVGKANALLISNAGNVGIGTTNPTNLFTVSSSADTDILFTTTNSTAHNRINFTNTGSSATGGLWYGSSNTMEFRTANSERMRIDSSGRLLVGLSSDLSGGLSSATIQSVSAGGAFVSLGRNDTSVGAGNGIGGLRFYSNDPTASTYNDVGIIQCAADGPHTTNDYPTRLEFHTTASGASSPTERMRIDSGGIVKLLGTSESLRLEPPSGTSYIGFWNGTTTAHYGFVGAADKLITGGSSSNLAVRSQADLIFATGGASERMRLDSSGNLGIGLTNPSEKLTVAGHINLPNVNSYIKGGGHNVLQVDATRTYFYGGSNGVQLRKADNSVEIVTVDNSGNATFAGSVTASNVSDIRFKENITDANPQLADAVALGSQLKNFDWNDDAPLNEELRAKRFLGLVAQEAEKVCPGLTYTVARTKQGKELTPETTDAEGNVTPATYEELDDSYKAINHDILVMKLLGAVAELSAKIETLETKVNALEGA